MICAPIMTVTYEPIVWHPHNGDRVNPLSEESRKTYPVVVEMSLPHEYMGRDPRKVWLYDTFRNSSWMTEDMFKITHMPGQLDRMSEVVRLFRFRNAQEAMVFRLRWQNVDN